MNNHSENKIPILSFFSGGGFLDMGFEQAGFNIIWTNENNEVFAKMHSHGITAWRKAKGNGLKAEIFNTKSIEDITPEEILKEAFSDCIPKNFGIIGGPPCQDFSSAGNNEGFEGGRGRLTEVFFEYIVKTKPLFFVFENVRNLWNNNEHKRRLKIILLKVQNYYLIDHEILNSIDYGVPQDRNRLFIVGIRKKENSENSILEIHFKFPWPINLTYKNSLTRYNWPDTNTFQKQIKIPKDIPPELCVANFMLKRREEKLIANGKEYFKPYSRKFWEIEEGNTHNRSFKRLHRFRYSPTACYGNNEVHLHPFLPRRISVREALRIQSVDDSYTLPSEVGLTPKFKMIGNGVPVKLAFEVARSLQFFLKKYY
jgi:DNA (cytosine-5)-methyltransferase 1